jgi:hypothetical protein
MGAKRTAKRPKARGKPTDHPPWVYEGEINFAIEALQQALEAVKDGDADAKALAMSIFHSRIARELNDEKPEVRVEFTSKEEEERRDARDGQYRVVRQHFDNLFARARGKDEADRKRAQRKREIVKFARGRLVKGLNARKNALQMLPDAKELWSKDDEGNSETDRPLKPSSLLKMLEGICAELLRGE